jgi:DNA modification methylase
MIFETALNDTGFEVKNQLIWNKGMVLGRSDYHWSHEPFFYCRKTGNNNEWYGDRKHKTIQRQDKVDFSKFRKSQLVAMLKAAAEGSTVWEIAKDSVKTYLHPTQKPVDLCTRAIMNSTIDGEIVMDLFGGSGSTIIGCEQTRRHGRLMELDPQYADVIVQRWQNYTGRDATLEDDGRAFYAISKDRPEASVAA